MKRITFTLLAGLILLMGCDNKHSDIRNTPKEAKKCIITKYYEPLQHNGELICGKELDDAASLPDMTYYDEYNNLLLRVILESNAAIRYHYLDPSKKLNDFILIETGDGESKGKIEYIRNEHNKLIEIKHSGETFSLGSDPVKYVYNDKGERKEAHYKNYYILMNSLPSANGQEVRSYKEIKPSCKYSYNGTSGLTEEGTEIFDDNDLLQRKIIEHYDYGHLHSVEDYIITYNENGEPLKEEMNGKTAAHYYGGYDVGMSEEEIEKWTIQNYYSPPKYKKIGHIKEWRYNEKGDVISYMFTSLDWSTYTKWEINEFLSEEYEYEYNEKGDWIKQITYAHKDIKYDSLDIRQREYEERQPRRITMREIVYY